METAPVVLIAFNRPQETKEVFRKIRAAKVPKLYIVVDAPRENNESDRILNEEVLAVFNDIDWDCDVKKNIASKNMGVGPRPYTGIDWVFENEEMAIILEDDCVPSLGFFDFCTELLHRYKDDPRIMHISGSRYNTEFEMGNNDSYFFSRYQFNWGWATWRRSWKKYDFEMGNYDAVLKKNYLNLRFSQYEARYWRRHFDRVKVNKAYMWDFQWQYAIFMNAGLCIFPKENLITNIDPFGTTVPNFVDTFYFNEVDDHFKIEAHPEVVCTNDQFDIYYFNKHVAPRKTITQKIIGKIRKIFIPKSVALNKAKKKLYQKKESYYAKVN
jgi:hypothetical protein